MGYKRPLDAYDFEKLPFKQSQGFDYGSEISSVAQTDSHYTCVLKPSFGEDEDCCFDFQWYDAVQKGGPSELTHVNYKGGESSTPLSSYSEDDTGSGATPLSSVSTDSFEFECPHRKCFPFDENDVYLDDSRRRLVPVDPNHQASIPTWPGSVEKILDRTSFALGAGDLVHKDEEKLMGKVIILMPDPNLSHEDDHAGHGRLGCDCMDIGSVRCVRQHVMEARENIKKTLGCEHFTNLGFYSMGEEVTCTWSDEEEDTFHDTVYSYPASLGSNFWKHLSSVFPSRTKKELVSYYFNVFMLRKRAAQNRSKLHDIDSDDDEFHGSDTAPYHLHISEEEDEDSAIESLDNQYVLEQNPKLYSGGDQFDDEDDGDATDDVANSPDEYVNVDPSEACMMSQVGKACSHLDMIEQVVKEDLSVQDNSCMSFDCENNMVRHCDSLHAASSLQGGGFKSKYSDPLAGKGDCSIDMMNQSYFMESCDSKGWYPIYLTGLANDVDFLPTSNIIEEIFGDGSPEKKQKLS